MQYFSIQKATSPTHIRRRAGHRQIFSIYNWSGSTAVLGITMISSSVKFEMRSGLTAEDAESCVSEGFGH